jgi:hypothetical protein
MTVIGLQCLYLGTEPALRRRRARIVGVLRGSARPERMFLVQDEEELENEPVRPEELVRVRFGDTRQVADVRATDLDVFRHLVRRTMRFDVELDEATGQALLWAAQTMRRPLAALVNDAVAAHVLTLGVGRLTERTLVGIPAAH